MASYVDRTRDGALALALADGGRTSLVQAYGTAEHGDESSCSRRSPRSNKSRGKRARAHSIVDRKVKAQGLSISVSTYHQRVANQRVR